MEEVVMYKCSYCDKVGTKQTISRCENKHVKLMEKTAKWNALTKEAADFKEKVCNEVTSFYDLCEKIQAFAEQWCPEYHFQHLMMDSKFYNGVITGQINFSMAIKVGTQISWSNETHPLLQHTGSNILKHFMKIKTGSGGGGASNYSYSYDIDINDYPLILKSYNDALRASEAAELVVDEGMIKMKELVSADEIVKAFDKSMADLNESISVLRSQYSAAQAARSQYVENVQDELHKEYVSKIQPYNDIISKSCLGVTVSRLNKQI